VTKVNIKEVLMIGVAIAVLVLFTLGVLMAGRRTPADMPQIVIYFVSAVSGALAANLGAVLGISAFTWNWSAPEGKTEFLQWFAACWYLGVIVLATVLWGIAGFSDDTTQVVSILPELTKNGIGIFVAILAAILGVKTISAGRERAD
jgi:hypothetical protein